ncbi:MAG TPA: pantoate--beta-alanine ligase [Chloroflexota bacterium]|nr:pantoate--beta-alanine ligase [Chloroflexota bacterium]
MRIVETRDDMRTARSGLPEPVGVVPTMGYLHEGHAALIRRARDQCASVIVTLFVNPRQFGPNEDFARYPRDFARDRALCESLGVDLLYAPSVDEVYPPGFATSVDVSGLSEQWEGAHRPGHFRGVATVVAKLLIGTRADRAYFGEKDYQQLQVVKRLVLDLEIPTAIVPCPTVREADGLALSSRNAYLTPDDRPRATALHRGLMAARSALAGGERDARRLADSISQTVVSAGLTLDYAAVVDPTTLAPLDRVDRPARALVAARLGRVRLIDNLELA